MSEAPHGPSTAEVRAWAEKRGLIDPGTRGRLSAELFSMHATEMAALIDVPAPAPPAGDDGGELPLVIPARTLPPAAAAAAEPAPKEETPPQRKPKEKAADRARRFWDRRGKPEEDGGKPQRPRAQRKRVSLETLGGLVWAGVARLTAFAGETYAPVTKMMSFQAPVAGAVIEDLAKGTIADRIAQPIARLTESGGAVGALVGAPVLTAVVCRQPSLYPQARPMLMAAMKEWVIVAGPKIREMKRREEKFAEEMGEFQAEFGVTAEELLDMVFADLVSPVPADLAAANGSPA